MDAKAGLSHVSLDLKHVAQWCCSHSLLINPEKAKLMRFIEKMEEKSNRFKVFIDLTTILLYICADKMGDHYLKKHNHGLELQHLQKN